MPGTSLSALHMLFLLIFTKYEMMRMRMRIRMMMRLLRNREVSDLPRITWLVSVRARS